MFSFIHMTSIRLFALMPLILFSSSTMAKSTPNKKPQGSVLIGPALYLSSSPQLDQAYGFRLFVEQGLRSLRITSGISWHRSQANRADYKYQRFYDYTIDRGLRLSVLNKSILSLYGATSLSLHITGFDVPATPAPNGGRAHRGWSIGYNYGGGVQLKPNDFVVDLAYQRCANFGTDYDFLDNHEISLNIGVSIGKK